MRAQYHETRPKVKKGQQKAGLGGTVAATTAATASDGGSGEGERGKSQKWRTQRCGDGGGVVRGVGKGSRLRRGQLARGF